MSLQRSKDLRREVDNWESEGLISNSVANALRSRYLLDQPDKWYRQGSLLLRIVASLLLFFGVVLLISENWHYLGIPLRMATGIVPWIFAAVMGVRSYSLGATGRGDAWIFGATLLFGANIFLQGQIFHLSGYWPSAIMAWTIGAGITAAATRCSAHVVLSNVLATMWYASEMEFDYFRYAVPVTSILLSLLALRVPGRMVLVSLTVMVGMALAHMVTGLTDTYPAFAISLHVAFLMAIAIVDRFPDITQEFRRKVTHTYRALYVWPLLVFPAASHHEHPDLWIGLSLVAVVAACAVALYRRALDVYHAALVLSVLWCIVCLFPPMYPGEEGVQIVLEVVWFSAAIIGIWRALKAGEKPDFMTGVVIVVVLAVSRFSNHYGDYLLTAAVFVGAGLLVLLTNEYWNRRHAVAS